MITRLHERKLKGEVGRSVGIQQICSVVHEGEVISQRFPLPGLVASCPVLLISFLPTYSGLGNARQHLQHITKSMKANGIYLFILLLQLKEILKLERKGNTECNFSPFVNHLSLSHCPYGQCTKSQEGLLRREKC